MFSDFLCWTILVLRLGLSKNLVVLLFSCWESPTWTSARSWGGVGLWGSWLCCQGMAFAVNDHSCFGSTPVLLTWEIRNRESCQHVGQLIGTCTLLKAPRACDQWEAEVDFPLSRACSGHVTQLLLPNNWVPMCGTGDRLAPNEDYLLCGHPGLLSRPQVEGACHFWLSRLVTQGFGKK